MFGTRKSFLKAKAVNKILEVGCPEHIEHQRRYLQRLYQQSKQISQIIAYIWRWGDAEEAPEKKRVANELRSYFESPTSQSIGDNLKKLFGADPTQGKPEFPDPAYLLKQVFYEDGLDNSNYIFPIFDTYELGEQQDGLGYSFEITFSNFEGEIIDADNNDPQILKMIIPYPPRPQLGEITLTQETLDNWIENRDPNRYFSENPYIPLTCS